MQSNVEKLIAQAGTFVLLMIHPKEAKTIVCNSHAIVTTVTKQQRPLDQILKKYHNVFELPTWVPSYCQVKHSIELILGTPLPNWPMHRSSTIENDKIKR